MVYVMGGHLWEIQARRKVELAEIWMDIYFRYDQQLESFSSDMDLTNSKGVT